MSMRYKGGVISATAPTTSTSAAKGMWAATQLMQAVAAGNWPRVPGAPTIGTATGGELSATVTYTAPTDAGTGAVTYTGTSTPGGITSTGASPLTFTGLTGGTSYTFAVAGTTPGGTGPSSAASNAVTPTAPVTGQQQYVSAGTFSWVAPAGVTSVSVVCVAAGGPTEQNANRRGSGDGGALSYKNNITVVPGSSYTVFITNGEMFYVTPETYFISAATVRAFGRSTRVGDGGGNGGTQVGSDGGGGAGGYSGNGGSSLIAGAGGGGGGGGYVLSNSNTISNGGGGGGVGLLGQGSSGSAGGENSATNRGVGGSSGANGTNGSAGVYGNGGNYGGGAARTTPGKYGEPGTGALRIIWPGTTRSFPSTNTGNL